MSGNKKRKKQKKSINSYLKLIILFLLLISIIITVFILNKTKRIDPNSKQVSELYTYLGSNDPNYCEGIITYDSKKITYTKIKDKIKVCNAFINSSEDDIDIIKIDKTKKNNNCTIGNVTFATEKTDDDVCTVQRIKTKKLKETYKKIYGKEMNNTKSFDLNSTTICYPDNDYYYCGLKEKFTYIIGAETKTYRNITKKHDYLYIYDYFIKTEDNECYLDFKTNKSNPKCSKNLKDNKKIDYSFIKMNGKKYKHTFKKINKNYSWVSSEPL